MTITPVFTILVILLGLVSFDLHGKPDRETKTFFMEDFGKPPGERWKQVKFEDLTDYKVVNEDTNACLKASANGTASAFATKVSIKPGNLSFRWRWKIDTCPKNGTDDKAASFDHSARIFIAFDTLIGPPRTINYVWGNQAKKNATFDHPSTGRSKFITMQTGNDKAGQWLAETRDVQADWQLLFPDETMPKIVGIGVFTDSDGTRVPVTGWYDDIVLEQK